MKNTQVEIRAVELNQTETALYSPILLDEEVLAQKEYGDRARFLENMGLLAESLIKRGAVPQVRLDSFTDPEMNPGGRGRSRKEIFEKNGTTGKAILRHPHFIKHFRYFIFGPDLPEDVIAGFCKVIEDDFGTSGMVLDQIQAYVRRAVRSRGLDKDHVCDEFFKLAHEIGQPGLAEAVRSAAKSVR